MRLRIYTDENVDVAVAERLRRRGVDDWSARDAGNLGLSDEEQLEYARREQAVIFTHDVDFLRLAHREWQEGREHWGVIYAHVGQLTVGECIRRLMDYALFMDAEEMKNRIEFL